MSLIVALPRVIFSVLWTLLYSKRKVDQQKASYQILPDKPTDWTVYQWMRWLRRRFPGLQWEYTCRGKWVYIKITAPAPGYLTGLRDWLGGGVLTRSALVYAIALS